MSSVALPQSSKQPPCPLHALEVGSHGRVQRLHGEAALIERLLEQGLTVGTELRVLRRGLFRGNVQLSLRGYVLSLEASVAACIEVAPL